MTRHRTPLLAALAAVLVTLGALLLSGASGGGLSLTGRPAAGEPDNPPGAVLDDADRRALDAEPVRRGAEAPPPRPSVPLDQPDAVVRAYLHAAYALSAGDAGATHLRAAAYAEPGSPPASVGVLVLDAPPAGAERTATVVELDALASSDDRRRLGYRAVVETRSGPPGGPSITAYLTSDVVVAWQPDGRWLVAAETPENPDLLVGEH